MVWHITIIQMTLSIVTINYNNKSGLEKTLNSVLSQTSAGLEHIIIDDASSDGSAETIKSYAGKAPYKVNWVSEPDNGIYNAMNKGICMATGDYIQILNSGDMLAAPNVTERMISEVKRITEQEGVMPDIVYGNMTKVDSEGKLIGKSREIEYSLRQFYSSTLNHDCAYIKRDLFEKYGFYDENLKIVSDWKWYLQAIGLGDVAPRYVDIDVTIFDGGGISETNLSLRNAERRRVLEEVLPPAILWDYDHHAFDAEQMDRLRKRHLYWLVYFIERCLFKLEKWHILK